MFFDTLKNIIIVVQLYKFWCIFVNQRTYKSTPSEYQCINVLNIIDNDIKQKNAFSFYGKEYVNDRYIPRIVFSLKKMYLAYAYIEYIGLSTHQNITITVYTPLNYPLLIEDRQIEKEEKDTIKVAEHMGDSYHELVNEIAINSLISKNILNIANSCAHSIITKFHNDNKNGIVCLLHGDPGVGKSTTTRVVARDLNAILFSEYNPTKSKYNLFHFVNQYSHLKKPIVVVMEECDIILENIYNKNCDEKADITDKISWNSILDKIKRRKNIILILTTNKSYKNLINICKLDKSLLRKHRVDYVYEICKENWITINH